MGDGEVLDGRVIVKECAGCGGYSIFIEGPDDSRKTRSLRFCLPRSFAMPLALALRESAEHGGQRGSVVAAVHNGPEKPRKDRIN